LGLFSDFEGIIFWAWWIGLGSIAVSCLLFIAILALRYYFGLKLKKAVNFRKLWEPIIIESLDKIPDSLPLIKETDEFIFLILWNYLQEILLEESKVNLLILARRVNLLFISRKFLKRSSIKGKMLAINTLGWLKDEESWDVLVGLINHRETIFSLSVARALVRINSQKSVPVILRLIAERNDWSIDNCANLIKQIEMEDIADEMINKIYQTPVHLLPKMIPFLDFLLPSQSNQVVKTLITKYQDKEIIFACLNVFKDIDDLKTVRKFLTHENWEIRMQAAICLGKLGSRQDIGRLTVATMDLEWWVRYRSAQALAKMPSMTTRKLKNIANRNLDGFSNDVILRVVTEREVAESCGLTY
jgi:HEAT repeats